MEVKKLYVGTGWINVNMKLKLFLKTRENLIAWPHGSNGSLAWDACSVDKKHSCYSSICCHGEADQHAYKHQFWPSAC